MATSCELCFGEEREEPEPSEKSTAAAHGTDGKRTGVVTLNRWFTVPSEQSATEARKEPRGYLKHPTSF